MKLRYDKEADAAYISLKEKGKSAKTVPVTDDIILDFGSKGNLVGVEVLNARAHISYKDLKRAILRKIDIPIFQFA